MENPSKFTQNRYPRLIILALQPFVSPDQTSDPTEIVRLVIQGIQLAYQQAAWMVGVAGLMIAILAALGIRIYLHEYVEREFRKISERLEENLKKRFEEQMGAVVHDALARVDFTANIRQGYIGWQNNDLNAAITFSERALASLEKVKVTDERDLENQVSVKNNLAWYYAQSGLAAKETVAREYASLIAEHHQRFKQSEFLFTKAFVLMRYAKTPEDAKEALRTLQVAGLAYHNDQTVQRRVQERSADAEALVAQLSRDQTR